MPQEITNNETNSEEVQEIVTAVPAWILRWGITLIFIILASILALSSIIQYPDVVGTSLRVNSLNSPKPVVAKRSGKISSLIVKDGDIVKENQPLAYLETTGDPGEVIRMSNFLKTFQTKLLIDSANIPKLPSSEHLGELQSSFQTFYQQYLQYKSTQKNGYFTQRLDYLTKDLQNIKKLGLQIEKQKSTQLLEFSNQEEEYSAYKKLYNQKVISRSEFKLQENKYLASKYPIQQSESDQLNNVNSYRNKEKELLEIRHTLYEERAKFIQALNRYVNDAESWMLNNVLISPMAGKISFAGIVQQNQNIEINKEVFIVNPGNTDFFGEIQIPQYNMGKVKLGQQVLVRLKSYPYEQYGMIRGRLSYISDVAYHDSVFVAKINFEHFENKDPNRKIILKNGLQADAQIITENSSLLQRFIRNILKLFQNH